MKRIIISYFFVILYFLAIFRPFLPIIEYYINYDYIAEQLCENRNKPILACNGKCYLAKEIVEVTTDRSDERSSRIPAIELDKTPLSTIPKVRTTNVDIHTLLFNELYYSKNIKIFDIVNSVFRPPKI